MSTLDTTLLIQSPVAPASTTSTQSKPTEGFQQFLEDATHKVSNPAPKAKADPAIFRPARETLQPAKALQPADRRTNQAKDQPASDSNDTDSAEKPTPRAAKARSEISSRITQRRSVARDSKPETNEDSANVTAESTQRQDLPSETPEEVSGTPVLAPKEGVAKTIESEVPAPVAQTASAVALLASLLVQTTGDLKGTQVAGEAKPQIAESVTGVSAPALPATVQPGTLSTGANPWLSSATPISPEVLDGPTAAEDAPGVPADAAAVIQQAPTTLKAQALNLEGASSAKGLLADLSTADAQPIASELVPASTEKVVTAQTEPVPQNAIQTEVQPAASPMPTGKSAVAEKQQKVRQSQKEVTTKEKLPELKVSPELLTSRSLSQPGTETAAGDTPDKDTSSSNQQNAKPESTDIVRSLKSVVTANKETLRTQPAVHEVQATKGNVTHPVADFASLPQNQGTATKAALETGIGAVPGPEAAPSILSVPDLAAPAGVAEPAGRVVGAPQANVNWGQVEKAQVVSQIVERAQLLGKTQSELMVVLKPEFLGKVNLHAAMVDNQLVATIIAESPSVKQMLEGQLSSLHTALHEQGLPVAKVEVVQGSQLSFADLGTGQGSSQQHLESGKSQLPPSFARYETTEEIAEVIPQEARIYAPPTSRSLNLVA